MIFDHANNFNRYPMLQKLADSVAGTFGSTSSLMSMPTGRFDIDSDLLFGIRISNQTTVESECLWEAHRKYLDVHYILKGSETIFINDLLNMESTIPYHEEHDYQLFTGDKLLSLQMEENYFLVLFPNEVHKTNIMGASSNSIEKVVFKILVQ